jgi:hypothetical protein
MINVKRYSDKIDINERIVYEGIKFILFHFEKQHKLFPRTIKTKNFQFKVEDASIVQTSINKIFDVFKESDYYDCKINCIPYDDNSKQSHNTNIKSTIKSKTSAPESSFIMIYLTMADFSYDKRKLDIVLNKTLKKLSVKFYGDAYPTVLWVGNGYRIYQPLDGMIFENDKTFFDLFQSTNGQDIATEFLKFAQIFFTEEKGDTKKITSIKSCFLEVPGTFNYKNGEQIKIIHKWDGKNPSIKWISYDFKNYLMQKRIDKIHERKKEIEKKIFALGKQQENVSKDLVD